MHRRPSTKLLKWNMLELRALQKSKKHSALLKRDITSVDEGYFWVTHVELIADCTRGSEAACDLTQDFCLSSSGTHEYRITYSSCHDPKSTKIRFSTRTVGTVKTDVWLLNPFLQSLRSFLLQ